MGISFEYPLGQKVKIEALGVAGIIIGYYYGQNGAQYEVAYFVDGMRKTAYLYPQEFSSTLLSFSGFLTK